MPSANIKINGVAASSDDLPINTIVQLDNANTGGETTYLWEVLDQPEGAADALSNSSIHNPTLTPKKEGSYILRLTVNQGQGSQVSNTRIAAVRQLKTGERVPSAFETFEVDLAKGWKTTANRLLVRLDRVVSDANLVVCLNANSSPPVVGDVVAFTGVDTIKTGLPGQESIVVVQKALATSAALMGLPLGVVVGTPSGTAPGASSLVVVRRFGLVEVAASGSPSVGDRVFVSNTARPAASAGANTRRIGSVLSAGGGSFTWLVDGSFTWGP